MGPYYRSTSQGVGTLFELIYDHPILMLVLVSGVVGASLYVWKKRKTSS